MLLFPFERFVVHSPYNQAQAKERIESVTETLRFVRLTPGRKEKPMEGFMLGNRFLIKRKATYRNAFLPRVLGEILPEGEGSKIRMRLKLRSHVLIMMAFWLALVGYACVWVLTTRRVIEDNLEYFLAIPVALLVIGYIIALIGFRIETRKMKKFLCDLFDGTKAKSSFRPVRRK